MTLTYLGPAVGAGDGLIVPTAAALDPLLAEAVLLLRASERDGHNEGTAGAALDAWSAAYVPALAAGFGGQEAQAATCPDANDLDLTSGFCVAVNLTHEWQPAIPQQILSKPTEGNADTHDCYAVGFDNNGHPFLEWDDTVGGHNGPSFIAFNGATEDVTFPAGVTRRELVFEFIADNGAGGWTARVYSGVPGATTLLSEIVNTTDGAQTMNTSTDALRIGDPLGGAVHRVRLYDSLGGTLLRDFYPARDWISGTTMTSSTGEVWSNVLVAERDGFVTLTVSDDPGLDIAAGASATLALWFTQRNVADNDGEFISLAGRFSGTNPLNGWRVIDAWLSGFGLDFSGGIVGDGTDTDFIIGTHWTAGTHLVLLTFDRGADTATVFVDGASHATASIAGYGALDPAADLTLGNALHHAAAKWDRVLDGGDLAQLSGLWPVA